MADPTYAPGRSDDGYARLTEQANFLRRLTDRFFRKAGISPGLSVLDFGSGAGDVAFLLSELVGRDGKIVGVDMEGSALEKARRRAGHMKLRNVEFVHGGIRTIAMSGPFDSAVGRLVLLQCMDPAHRNIKRPLESPSQHWWPWVGGLCLPRWRGTGACAVGLS